MIRAIDVAGAVAGGLVIVALGAAWLWAMPLARAAEPCEGRSVSVSWYGLETCAGRPPGRGKGTCHTASDLPFDGSQLLVAHKTLPMGAKVRFTYRGRSIVLQVLDRGPYVAGREFDLSHAAAVRLGTVKAGVAKVCAERL